MLFHFSLDDLRNAATADAKLSNALQEKDIKIAEMEQRYFSLTVQNCVQPCAAQILNSRPHRNANNSSEEE